MVSAESKAGQGAGSAVRRSAAESAGAAPLTHVTTGSSFCLRAAVALPCCLPHPLPHLCPRSNAIDQQLIDQQLEDLFKFKVA